MENDEVARIRALIKAAKLDLEEAMAVTRAKQSELNAARKISEVRRRVVSNLNQELEGALARVQIEKRTTAKYTPTKRQAKVLSMRQDGLTFAEIGEKLGVTPVTARYLYLAGIEKQKRGEP